MATRISSEEERPRLRVRGSRTQTRPPTQQGTHRWVRHALEISATARAPGQSVAEHGRKNSARVLS